MYELIACDLDETLLTTDKKVSKENIEAIKKAEELGVKFVTASGRAIKDMKKTVEVIGQETKENEYIISFNGGAISENNKENEFLFTKALDFDFADKLYQIGQNYDVGVQVYTKEAIFIYNYTEEERALIGDEIEVIEIFDRNLDFLKGEEIIKIIFMNTDQTYLEKIEKELKELTVHCDISYSSNRYLEFNQKGANKGAALEYIANHLGIEMSKTLAIGDNFNDWPMFEQAAFSVGVRNMREELKSEVDYITEATNNEHAVAEAIEKFILTPAKL